MPTYEYRCKNCDKKAAIFQSISDYSMAPIRPTCCFDVEMERMLSVVPAMSGLANALAGDRHYEGMRAPDGTDISSRTKHREYMKRTGMTTADDYKETWSKAQAERELARMGKAEDKDLRKEITEQVMTAVAQPT